MHASDGNFYGNSTGTVVTQRDGGDLLVGGAGSDELYGGYGDDDLRGGDDEDFAAGGAGKDWVSGGNGNDTLLGDAAVILDHAYRLDSNFWIDMNYVEDQGEDTLYGGFGNDVMYGLGRADFLSGDDGDDLIMGDSPLYSDEWLDLLGKDTLLGGRGNDTLIGGGEADLLDGGEGDDWLYGDSKIADELPAALQGADTLSGGDGSDQLYGGRGNDVLGGDGGADNLYGEVGEDTLSGGDGNDELWGSDDNDLLIGGAGNDTLHGGDGNDTLIGDAGNDLLMGGSGDDTYEIAAGSVIKDNEGKNTIRVRNAASAKELKILPTAIAGGISLTFTLADGSTASIESSSLQSSDFAFEAGERLSVSQVMNAADVDAVTFTATADSTGVALMTGRRNDHLEGGSGQDWFASNDGDDGLVGGAGNDTLDGGGGNDSLSGNTGDDVLIGGAGHDVYFFESGDGVDVISDEAGVDIIRFGAGITLDSVWVQLQFDWFRGAWYTVLHYGDQGDAIYLADGVGQTIESFEFAEGTSLSWAQLMANAPSLNYAGDERDETLYGTDYADVVNGGSGDDAIFGQGGGDNLQGGIGNDLLDGGDGGDSLAGGEGDDFLAGGTGNDLLRGDAGNDTLAGGGGADTLAGGDGNDIYLANDGNVVIQDALGFNAIQFGTGIAAADVTVTQTLLVDGTRYLEFSYAGGSVKVLNGDLGSIQEFRFEGGTVLGLPDMLDRLAALNAMGTDNPDDIIGSHNADVIYGGNGNDTITGRDGNDVVAGDAGNDLLLGDGGADTLLGGSGDDTLIGGGGADTYSLALGMGRDLAVENAGESSTLRIAAGVVSSNVNWRRDGDDLVVSLKSSGESLTIQDYYTADQTWSVVSPSGETSTMSDYLASLTVSGGGALTISQLKQDFKDAIEASVYANVYSQGAQVGADGKPHKTVVSGSDVTQWNYETSFVDQNSNDKNIFVNATSGDIVRTAYSSTSISVPVISGASLGGRIDGGFGSNAPQAGGFYPGGAPVIIRLPAGSSGYSYNYYWTVPFGYSGSLATEASNASSHQTVTQTSSTYLQTNTSYSVVAGAADNTIYAGTSSMVDAGVGNDTIVASNSWYDSPSSPLGSFLYGNDGNDSIGGSNFNDVLIGGAGNDSLSGGDGNDTYIFFNGDGADFVIDGITGYSSTGSGGYDEIVLPEGVDLSSLVITRGPSISLDSIYRRYPSSGTLPWHGEEAYSTVDLSWGTTQRIRVVLPHSDNAPQAGIEYLRFADGSAVSFWTVLSSLGITPVQDDNNAVGTRNYRVTSPYSFPWSDPLLGGAGNDTLSGSGWLDGGSGNDLVTGGTGDDTLIGQEGTDTLVGGEGDDLLGGSLADFWTSSDGISGNLYDGGKGNDTLVGTAFEDTYYFSLGDGNDLILDDTSDFSDTRAVAYIMEEYGYGGPYARSIGVPDAIASDGASKLWQSDYFNYYGHFKAEVVSTAYLKAQDNLVLGPGIRPEDVLLKRNNGVTADLVLEIAGASDSITIRGWFGDAHRHLKQIEFSDGTIWDNVFLDAIQEEDLVIEGPGYLEGSSRDDLLTGSAEDQRIAGHAGNDTINGGSGDDVIFGGLGDDSLTGGVGDDTYVFSAGDGNDTIVDNGGNDLLQIDGTAPGVTLDRNDEDLLVRLASTGEVITVKDWYLSNVNKIEKIGVFDSDENATITWDATQILAGELGDHGYHFSVGSGSRTITNVGSFADKLFIDGGVIIGEVALSRSGSDLLVSLNETTELITLKDWYLDDARKIETIEIYDNTVDETFVWDAAYILELAPLAIDMPVIIGAAEDELFSLGLVDAFFPGINASDIFSYEATRLDGSALPTWLSFDLATQSFIGTPTNDDLGSLDVSITSHGIDGDQQWSFRIVVANTNDAPVPIGVVADVAGKIDAPFTYVIPDGLFHDDDLGDSLTLSATLPDGGYLPAWMRSPLPSWLSFDPVTRTLGGTPSAHDLGVVAIQINATDAAGANTSIIFNLNVSAAPDPTAVGTADGDVITGTADDDIIDGLSGADTMLGGLGDDTYYVDDIDDLVTENVAEGHDTVITTTDELVLPESVEDLTLASNITGNGRAGTGNALDNVIIGSSSTGNSLFGLDGNDVLIGSGYGGYFDGGTGADTMIGGDGSGDALAENVFIVDDVNDVVIASAVSLHDLVQSSVSYALSENVDNLSLQGTDDIDATGNGLSNWIWGNDGNNHLYGGAGDDKIYGSAGYDTMYGGQGNDTYSLDDIQYWGGSLYNNTIIEAADEGIDLIRAYCPITTFVLPDNIENIEAGGGQIFGNELDNHIQTMDGADTLAGGLGNDTLEGREGADAYLFNRGDKQDVVLDNDGRDDYYYYDQATQQDTLTFGAGVSYDQLWFARTGDDLNVQVIGTQDAVTISNWYVGDGKYHIEHFNSGDGKTLLDSQVDNLVSAMAAFAPPSAGQTILPTSYQSSLNTVIAASWQ